MACYLNHLGIINALGTGQSEVLSNMLKHKQTGLVVSDWVPGFQTYVAQVQDELEALPATINSRYHSRNNQLAWTALSQILDNIEALKQEYGAHRIGVVIGTSTSGIGEGEKAVIAAKHTGKTPDSYCYQQQEIGTVAEFIAEAAEVFGPAYTISTACSSSGHAFNSASQMIKNGLVDAVIVGGVDSLCKLTVNGFASLESVSNTKCTPFSINRNGINIGEAAALFIMSAQASANAVELLAVGSSSDAHHISAPEPNGEGAERAIRSALTLANITPDQISYINLHGTGTQLNDAMESKVVERIFGSATLCSSSKGQVGHTLGAAAANELALCWLSLHEDNTENFVPPHLWDGQCDPELAKIQLADTKQRYSQSPQHLVLSNSFAFGGNNTAVLIRSLPSRQAATD